MSYASVVAQNAQPKENQPKPNPNLLEGSGSFRRFGDDQGLRESTTDPNFMSEENVNKPTHVNSEKTPDKNENELLEEDAEEIADDKKDRKKQAEESWAQRGILAVVTAAALGATALAAFKNWDQPRWDKRVVSSVTIGIAALLGSQGFFEPLGLLPKKKL
ncbi:hypothetical protein O181_015571 [Austropuccinia psidii MF-1]|uniref:Uncharacterized protein n=1 Tax=Austropuccinia psidii MF-1 TaxID=1389203 RepID=A0A9Q3GQ84_9BASI|nr:hypothetical protein [Austropuccinia psidii MF-1]